MDHDDHPGRDAEDRAEDAPAAIGLVVVAQAVHEIDDAAHHPEHRHDLHEEDGGDAGPEEEIEPQDDPGYAPEEEENPAVIGGRGCRHGLPPCALRRS